MAAVVLDHNGHPVAGVAVTYRSDPATDLGPLIAATQRTAEQLTVRLGGTVPRQD